MYTSIIMTAWIQSPQQAQMTMSSIANITRYTDPSDYELIVMSADEKFPIRDDYKCLKIDQYVHNHLGYTESMNEGAVLATGDIFVFMQNDVYVYEGWLPMMRYYIENDIVDVVYPDQVERPREFVKQSYEMSMEEAMKYGSRDAGLLMITRDGFAKTGGWDPELTLLAERDFYDRIGQAGLRWTDTYKTMITHIRAGTNLTLLHENPQEYDRRMKYDSDKLNG